MDVALCLTKSSFLGMSQLLSNTGRNLFIFFLSGFINMIDNLSTAYAAGVYLEFISGRKPSQVGFLSVVCFCGSGYLAGYQRYS